LEPKRFKFLKTASISFSISSVYDTGFPEICASVIIDFIITVGKALK